jgi:hypothetical protein
LSCPQLLLLPLSAVGSTVQVQARDLLTGQPFLPNQLQQRFLDRDVQQILQFGDEVPGGSLMDEGFRSAQQRTVSRKPNRLEHPEAMLIEVGDFL